jgi:hypothetical protein
MSDAELIAWLESGATATVSPEEAAARRAADFARRFGEALASEDLGPTQELHDSAQARLVYGVHAELNALGEEAYSDVWRSLSAPVRASIKRCIELARA